VAPSSIFPTRIGTWMSGIFVALFLLAARPAHATVPAATIADNLDARHSLGFQVGGSAVAQVVYRLRVFSHAYLEIGGAGAPEGALNGSIGLLVAHSTGTRLFPYAGAGLGFAGQTGPDAQTNAAGESCLDAPECPWSGRGLAFFYVRAGVGLVLETTKHISLGLDIGTWIGEAWHRTDDGNGGKTFSSRRIVWPMAGLAGFYSF
jgi:hypothetical protein